jgi:solute carrier family 45 protein 1/2/4
MESGGPNAHENSPLVGPRASDDLEESVIVVRDSPGMDRNKNAQESSEKKSSWYLFLLTLSIGG